MIYLSMLQVKMSGIPRAYLGSARTSASFLSPKQFEEFALPALMEMCDYYARRDISVVLHLDDDWTPFFHYFKDLPRGTYIINLDGKSDIFKARDILGDQMCIMGDVPADLLKLGEPDEVDEYCRRLIMEVGAEGGFILSSGCSMPADAKPENVRAMIQSVKKYRP
jgi:uroporphyrinogen-III decarboxylase